MIFEKKTLFLQVYVNCSKKFFSHLQVCTIYLVNYYISKLVDESKTFLCSKHKLVKSKFFVEKNTKTRKIVKCNKCCLFLPCVIQKAHLHGLSDPWSPLTHQTIQTCYCIKL